MKTTAQPLAGARRLSIREAKAHLSELVGQAAAGAEVTITCHGQPKARLSAAPAGAVPFMVDRARLRGGTVVRRGSRAEDLVRSDRDGRD